MYIGNSIAKSAPALRINLTEQFTVLILTHLLEFLPAEALAGTVGDEEEAGVVAEGVMAEVVGVLQTVGEEVVVAKALNKDLQMPTAILVADGLTESS